MPMPYTQQDRDVRPKSVRPYTNTVINKRGSLNLRDKEIIRGILGSKEPKPISGKDFANILRVLTLDFDANKEWLLKEKKRYNKLISDPKTEKDLRLAFQGRLKDINLELNMLKEEERQRGIEFIGMSGEHKG